MFRKKKLYEIIYKTHFLEYTTIIDAKNEIQAFRKFKREMKRNNNEVCRIISFKEYSV